MKLITPTSRELLGDIEDALSGALGDLEAWAQCHADGMTKVEKARFQGYERALEKLRKHIRSTIPRS